ncbi:hypothetical protein GCM10009530_15680 [Microbispora corallina]|uniref:Ricin B lectin domain-containing protein n=1 Tax=Microbispora corallina TaxID=83302 RepID=A0ABQ4FXG8_9ACTN|nr:RICIN domain-containing protein [Microbispora corallina]GIH39526.1 hypothetical protein Mco01_25260 [Microbispora corallina]
MARSIVALVAAVAVLVVQAIVPATAAHATAGPAKAAPAPGIPASPPPAPASPAPPPTASPSPGASAGGPAARAEDLTSALDAVRRAAARQPVPETKTASRLISPAAAAFLSTGLGLNDAGSRLVTGLRDGDDVRLTTDAPEPRLTLPKGVEAPAFGPATLVLDGAADTLTVTASGERARLSVTVAHVSTTALKGGDLTGRVSVTLPFLGTPVGLSGDVAATGDVRLSGALAQDVVLQKDVAVLAKGAVVTLGGADGLSVSGSALLGGTGRRLRVDVAGPIRDPREWSLAVSHVASAAAVVPGLALAPDVTGTVTASHGAVGYDVHGRTAGTWRPLPGVSVSGATVEIADRPPHGDAVTAPGAGATTPWLAVTGGIGLDAGSAGTVAGSGTVAVNLATGAGVITGRQTADAALTSGPNRLVLGRTGFRGTLDAGGAAVTGAVSGSGVVTAAAAQGPASVSDARVDLTGSGRLVAAFPADRARLGLPAPAQDGRSDVFWASGPVSGFAVSDDTRVDLPAGLSGLSGASRLVTPQAAASDGAASAASPAPLAAAGGQDGTTYTLSGDVYHFLADTLGIPVGSSPSVSGTVSGQTLTLTVGPPNKLPVTLPAGVPAPSFGPTTLTVDTATGTLTLHAEATSGVTAALDVTVAHAATSTLGDATDLTATLTLGGVPFVAGSTVTLQGALTYTGGTLGASLQGSLTSGLTVARGFTLQPGTTLTLSTGAGLTLDGTAQVGAGDGAFTVHAGGAFHDLRNWTLSVSDASAPVWQPLPSLSVVPSFTGSVTSTDGVVGFTLTAGSTDAGALLTWSPGDGATLRVNRVQVSNQEPADGLACPSGIAEGDVWADLHGSFDYTPAGLALDAEGCVNLTARSFTIGTTATGELLKGNPAFSLTSAGLTATGRAAAGGGLSLTVTGHASLQVTGPSGTQSGISAAVSFGADGIVAAGTVGDLHALSSGLSGTGTAYISSREIARFRPADLGLPGDAFPAAVRLEPGVTLTYSGTLPSSVTDAFGRMGVQVPATSLLAVATVSTTGVSVALDVNFRAGGHGLQVFSTNGTAFSLDDVTFALTVGSSTTVTVSGSGVLHMPPVAPGGKASDATLVVSGSLSATPPSLTLGIALSDWNPAFGVDGLSVGDLAGTIGVSPETVTVGFTAHDVTLPAAWGNVIGLAPGARTSLDVNLDLARPVLSFSIKGAQAGGIALTPLSVGYADKIASGRLTQHDRDVINSLVIYTASLDLAPFGGVTAAGRTVAPGVGLGFNTMVDGVPVNVEAAVGLQNPSIDADVSVGALPLGPVRTSQTHFVLGVAPTRVKLGFTGGVTYNGNSFQAGVDLAFGTTANGATVRLTLTAGVPWYLRVDGTLVGTVNGDGSGASFAAYGYGSFQAGGRTFGTVSFGVSVPGSLNWSDVVDSATSIAQFFVNQGVSLDQVEQILRSLGFSEYDILNALGSLGRYGSGLLDLVVSHLPFNNSYYNIWTYTSSGQILVLDVSGGSQSPNAGVLTYGWNGGYNQDWAFVGRPGMSGWYEIVNRNSGQCLSIRNNSTAAGEILVQYPCFGGDNQLWYLGGVSLNTTYYIRSLRSNLYVDVQSAYAWWGGTIDQWYYNGARNQQFWLTNAA